MDLGGGMSYFLKLFNITIFATFLSACVTNKPIEFRTLEELTTKFEKPKMCLALSGGGVRSASVSIGVLREIHQKIGLEKFDVISGTSGGSWAMLWLYTNSIRYGVQETIGELPEDTKKPIRKVDQRKFMENFWRVWTGVWSLFRAGDSAYFADLTGKFSGSPFYKLYTNINELKQTISENNLPIPIVNASIAEKACISEKGLPGLTREQLKEIPISERIVEFTPLKERTIEFTPFNWGNEAYGFSSEYGYKVDSLEDWTTLSGAYIDYPRFKSCKTLRMLGASWGEYVDLKKKSGFENDSRVFVADGGFAENLASFAPIRRSCDVTVIVDNEHDPSFRFEGYQNLKANLFDSLQKNIYIKSIDEHLSSKNEPTNDVFVADDSKLTLVSKPVYKGFVEDAKGVKQDIIYLKLSYDPFKESNYSEAVKSQYMIGKSKECKLPRGSDLDCSFPHTPTAKTAYTESEFKAHRELGQDLTRLHLTPILREFLF